MAIESLDAIAVEIKNKRKAAGISQKKLARFVKMSQSTVARLETDIRNLNPSYETVYKVIAMLDNVNNIDKKAGLLNKHAAEIMHKKIIYVYPETSIADAIKIIKSHDFTQLPVISKEGQSLGAVYQKTLVEVATQNPETIDRLKVSQILAEGLPQVDVNTNLSKIKRLLDHWDAVLVIRKSRVVGIITMSDVLKVI
jgi:predicted transcriptional regulator